MTRAKWLILLGLLLICYTAAPVSATESNPANLPQLPAPGMVTMIDLGAKKCIPCKMMAPIMEKMEKKYHGKAAIVFIDVWENREQASRFGIQAIPTQIFYDATGKEVSRHVGFMSEDDIVKTLSQLGVKP
ncbi:MAG: thioredoxin family protein [Deltaproteobacteria bacterium]|nr:thioredoxin family protein [Deltaproteobacteria bacterium]